MSKEMISDSQGIKGMLLFIMGSTLVMGTAGIAGRNTWISVVIAVIISIPVCLMYARVLYLYPGKDLFDILRMSLGKYIGGLFILLFIWFSFHLGAIVLRNFGEFIVTIALPETPMLIPMIFVTAACVYGVKGGIELLSRFSELFLIILIAIIAFMTLFSIPFMQINHIRPVMGDEFMLVLAGAFAAFAFPFGETVIFMMIFSSLNRTKSIYKVYLTALLIGGLIVVVIVLRNLLVLGENGVNSSYFPSYTAISRINIRRFLLQRLEILVSVVFLVAGFVKISFCLLAACKGVTKLFKLNDYRFIVTPIAILMTIFSLIVYKNIMEMSEWAFNVWTYYAMPFQLILPFIVYIAAEIKTRSKKTAGIKKEKPQ